MTLETNVNHCYCWASIFLKKQTYFLRNWHVCCILVYFHNYEDLWENVLWGVLMQWKGHGLEVEWSDLGSFVDLGAHSLCHPAGVQFPCLECCYWLGCWNLCWSLGGRTFVISSLPTCLPRRGGAGFLVLCLVPWHFRVWLRTSPCRCLLGMPNPFLLQILCQFLKQRVLNQLSTTEQPIKLHQVPDKVSEYKLRPVLRLTFCTFFCNFPLEM